MTMHYYATGNPRGHRINKDLREKLIRLLSDGSITIAEAADAGGVTYRTVSDWLKYRNIDWRLARQKRAKNILRGP